MTRTPLLRPLREQGATMYVFPSASEDIGLNLDNRVNHVALSHYALLNFPADENASNEWYAEQLQNYVMNCECTLTNQVNYNYQEYHTVTERIFWKWVEKQGYLNFKTYTSQLDSDGLPMKDYYIQLQKEEPSRFVQCFGSIDAGNSLSTEFGMFNETYINVPSSYGNGPVFFNTKTQDVGEQNCIIGREYFATQEQGYLEGRDSTQISQLAILENHSPEYDSASNKSYTIKNSKNEFKSYEIVKDFNLIQKACNEHFNTGKPQDQQHNYTINSFDDINVDANHQFMDEYNITKNKCEFEFNAILLYYSVYDQDDPTKSAYAVNLFGIIFLNGVSLSDNRIIGLTKRKSYGAEMNSFFGNSYSFRVNLKTMSVYDNTDAIINDNTTMTSIYSTDFSDVISNLNRAIDAMNTNVQTTMAIQDNYMRILRNNDETREFVENISTKINALINGSKTSALGVNRLCVNEIMPENLEDNMVKITLNRIQSDYIDVSVYQARPTIAPIIIRNDVDDFNVPTMYMPMISIDSVADGVAREVIPNYDTTDITIDNINNIINNTSIIYYKYDNRIYPDIKLPESYISDLNISNIYKVLNDRDFRDYTGAGTDSSISYINYNGLIPLMLLYIQDLQKRIQTLENS